MLDANLQAQLGTYLGRLKRPVELVATLDHSPAAQQMRELLDTVASLSPLVSVRADGTAARRPSFQVCAAGTNMGLHFAAVPLGHEFSSLVLALLHAGGHPPKEDAELLAQVQALPGEYVFETWIQ